MPSKKDFDPFRTEQNKTIPSEQNKQATIFSAKNEQSVFEPNFTKWKVHFEQRKKMSSSKECYLYRKMVKNAK